MASGDIPGVTVQGRPKPKPNNPRPNWSPEEEPMEGGGSCDAHEDCGAPDPGGSGGSTPSPNQEIINKLEKYPCAQALLEELPSLKNSLSELIQVAFKSNKKANVTFISANFDDPLLQGETKNLTTDEDERNGVVNFQIELSEKILKKSTQEYVLGVMYHEFVHAYLGYEFKRLGPNAYHSQYPYIENYEVGGVTKFRFITGDHQAYGPFINMIADAIQSYNPAFPRDRAISLAMEGITNEDLPNDGDTYNTLERYSSPSAAGTKCSNP
ncbi:hypothetical protein HZP64_15135 [Elizabethkingia anophelis]|nr:hypothetical protein [Elizabethkingia anophelis]